MGTKYNTKSIFKTSLLVLVILLSGLAFSGCLPGGAAVSTGCSGVVIDNDILFVGSMEGKLIAANTTDGRLLWEVALESPVSAGGGFLGCAPTSRAVAIYGSPAVLEDLTYVGGYDGRFYALIFGAEEWYWAYPRQDLIGSIVGSPVIVQDEVYFGSANGGVYALEANGLSPKWDKPFETGDKIWSTPAISENTLYIGSFDKKLYAIDTTTGKAKWEKPFETEGAIVSTPLVDNNMVYVGSFDRHLYAIDATSGSLKWKFEAGNWFWAKAVAYNDTIYAACLDGKVYALDAESGNKQVEIDLGSPVSSSPVLVDDLLIVVTEEGIVYAVDTDTNQQRQLTNVEGKVYAPLTASQGKVYIHTLTDALHKIDAQSGAKLWSISLRSATESSSEESSGTMNWGLIIGILVGGILLIIVFQALRRRRST